MKKGRYELLFSIVFSVLFILSSCGGSGTTSSSSSGSSSSGSDTLEQGDTTVQGLRIAESLSLVQAKQNTNGSINAAPRFLAKFVVPTTGAYTTDEAEYYVYDETSEVMDFVSEILCYFKQTKYNQFVNQGPYLALVETTKCNKDSDKSSSSTNQSSGANANKEYEKWIVNSARVDESSPQRVHFRVDHGDEEITDGPNNQYIYGNLTITEAPSSSNPYGVFDLYFVGVDSEGTETMTGFIKISETDDGLVDVSVYMDDDQFGINGHVVLDLDADEGHGKVIYTMSYDDSAFGEDGSTGSEQLATQDYSFTANFAYNSQFYLTEFDESGQDFSYCTSRGTYYTNVWEYKLYDESGDAVDLNAGGSYKYANSEGGIDYIWADYWGVWGPEGVVTDGAEVTDEDGNDYTIVVGDGRLMKSTKSSITLGDIKDDDFIYWDETSGEQWKIKWNGTNFVKTAIEGCGQDGCSFTDVTETIISFSQGDFIGLWKEGFGSLDFVAATLPLTDSTEIPRFEHSVVTPSDFDGQETTLHCYYECLKAPVDTDDPFLASKETANDGSYEYTFNPTEYTLKYNGTAITQSSSSNSESSGGAYSWGVWSGAMVTTSVADTITDPWEVWEATTSYNWETGPNAWNKYVALKDSNDDPVTFDSPITCELDHDTRGKFYLEYAGNGQLWGIPWEKVETDNSSSDFEHWTQAFIIADGTELTCTHDGEEQTYYVRGLVFEQVPAEVDDSNCSSLEVDSSFQSSSSDDFQSFDTDIIEGYGDTLGDNPSPAVVGGILTSSNS